MDLCLSGASAWQWQCWVPSTLSAVFAVRDVRIVIRLSKNFHIRKFLKHARRQSLVLDNSILYMGNWTLLPFMCSCCCLGHVRLTTRLPFLPVRVEPRTRLVFDGFAGPDKSMPGLRLRKYRKQMTGSVIYLKRYPGPLSCTILA